MSNDKPFILGINGSPRKDGHVGRMLALVLQEAEKYGAHTERIDLVDHTILPHDGKLNSEKYQAETADDMPELEKSVLAADGVVFASPTHWFNVSSRMKLFLDRLTSLEDYNFLLEGKVAGFVVYGPQGGALNCAMLMTMVANHMGMVIPPYAAIFDEGRKDDWLDKEYEILAKNMIQQINASKKMQLNLGYPDVVYKRSPIELLEGDN